MIWVWINKTKQKLSKSGCFCVRQCHYSYGECGLGADGTDRLVELVQQAQHSKSEDGTLYGAKITGGGCGGTVCAIGKNTLRTTQQIIEVTIFPPSCYYYYHRFLFLFFYYPIPSNAWSHFFLSWVQLKNDKVGVTKLT